MANLTHREAKFNLCQFAYIKLILKIYFCIDRILNMPGGPEMSKIILSEAK